MTETTESLQSTRLGCFTVPWHSASSVVSVILAVFVISPVDPGSAAPLHLLFWQESDIREGHNVEFEAHPFREEYSETLLPAESERPSLWYMPSDVIPVGEDRRIYYQRVEKTLENYADQRTWCLGVLRPDGAFVLPDLRLFPQSWDGPKNVVLQRSPHKPTWGGFNVFQTVGDSESGYQLLYWDQPEEGEAGGMIATSTDGILWRKEAGAVFTEHNDAYSLIQNEETGEYLLYQTRLSDWPEKPFEDNLPGKRRELSLRRSKDLRSWTPQAPILGPDSQDAPETEFYLFKVFRYVDRYAGLLMKYYGDPNSPGKHSAILRYELLFSQDGERWERPYRATDIGAWSYAAPFEQGNNLCLAAHSKGALVIYRIRKDGLVSCKADDDGSFWTRSFLLEQDELFLNADSSVGEIGVEVLDEKSQVHPGFEADNCRIMGLDATRIPLLWQGHSLEELRGKRVHLRFRLNDARVYSLQGD